MSWRVMDAGHYPFGFVDPPEHLTVENDTTHETVRYVPELTCVDLAITDTKFLCSVCGYMCKCAKCSSFDFSGLPWLAYCPNCGAKVVGR